MPWARLLVDEHLAAGSGALAVLAAQVPTLADAADHCAAALDELRRAVPPGAGGHDALVDALERGAAGCGGLIRRLGRLADRAHVMAIGMDFGFLYDPVRRLFSIGYRATDSSLDSGRY